MAVQIKGTFKKDDRPNNGLESIVQDLTKKPHERRIVVAIIRSVKTVIDHVDGTSTPTVNHEHIEVPVDDADAKKLWEVLAHAYETRTGNPMPPQSLFDGPGAGDTLEGQDTIPGVTPDADDE